jgi:hypothetical protein
VPALVLVTIRGAAFVVQAVSAQQIDAFDRPWGVGEPNRDPFSLPDAGDRSEAEFRRDAIIEVRPVFAIDTFESMLAVAIAQHEFSVGGCGIGATRAFLRTLAPAFVRSVEQDRHVFDAQLAIAGDEWEHTPRELQIEAALAPSDVLVAEQLPGVRELMPHIEQTPTLARQIASGRLSRGPPQCVAAFA